MIFHFYRNPNYLSRYYNSQKYSYYQPTHSIRPIHIVTTALPPCHSGPPDPSVCWSSSCNGSSRMALRCVLLWSPRLWNDPLRHHIFCPLSGFRRFPRLCNSKIIPIKSTLNHYTYLILLVNNPFLLLLSQHLHIFFHHSRFNIYFFICLNKNPICPSSYRLIAHSFNIFPRIFFFLFQRLNDI